jgi:hypothetical protein
MSTAEPPFVFEQLDLPDSSLARDAYAHAAQAIPAFLLNHSVRSYVFARARAQTRGLRPGSDYDEELLLVRVSNTATLTGVAPEPVITNTSEILRRQPDGGWLHVVDDPFFS